MTVSLTKPRPDSVLLRNGGSFESDIGSLLALTFGEMIERAKPVVTSYLSDFYHDAHWLSSYITGASVWWWSISSHGTHIGLDEGHIRYAASLHEDAVLYRVELAVDDRQRFTATFTVTPNSKQDRVDAGRARLAEG